MCNHQKKMFIVSLLPANLTQRHRVLPQEGNSAVLKAACSQRRPVGRGILEGRSKQGLGWFPGNQIMCHCEHPPGYSRGYGLAESGLEQNWDRRFGQKNLTAASSETRATQAFSAVWGCSRSDVAWAGETGSAALVPTQESGGVDPSPSSSLIAEIITWANYLTSSIKKRYQSSPLLLTHAMVWEWNQIVHAKAFCKFKALGR